MRKIFVLRFDLGGSVNSWRTDVSRVVSAALR
jgi:hypothetical protein